MPAAAAARRATAKAKAKAKAKAPAAKGSAAKAGQAPPRPLKRTASTASLGATSSPPTPRALKRAASNCSVASAASTASTRAPSSSCGPDSDSDPSPPPPAKRAAARRVGPRELCGVAHQFGLVGGEYYDSKATRLAQLLERLPLSARALVLAEPSSAAAAEAAVVLAAGRRAPRSPRSPAGAAAAAALPLAPAAGAAAACGDGEAHVEVVVGRTPKLPGSAEGYSLVINYDAPTTGEEYLRRAAVAAEASVPDVVATPRVVYTMVFERQLQGRGCRESKHLLRRAKRLAQADPALGGAAKAAEIESALQYIGNDYDCDEEGEEGEEGEGDDACDCVHCRSQSSGSVSYHALRPAQPPGGRSVPGVEVVRVPLQALEDLSSATVLSGSRLRDHACTLVCLHNMYCHTPWDGYEHLFALPRGLGSVRVVMVLATGSSWHDYPDVGSFAGGVAWTDILDMDSMDRADRLLERLVEHEVELLGGCGERLFLMGASQGGGQSMLRFLRTRRRLGGWIGSVCHAPTAPHTPRDRDPLADPSRPRINCSQPVRLLAGELDSTFPAPLVLRDAERLRQVGGFSDVMVTVQRGLTHEGPDDEDALPPELLFLQKHLPTMVSPPPCRTPPPPPSSARSPASP